MSKRIAAEFMGTLWLVLGGCGSAVISAAFPNLGIGFLGVAIAFGLTVVTMAYAIGPISARTSTPRYRWGCGWAAVSRRASCRATSSPRWSVGSSAPASSS